MNGAVLAAGVGHSGECGIDLAERTGGTDYDAELTEGRRGTDAQRPI